MFILNGFREVKVVGFYYMLVHASEAYYLQLRKLLTRTSTPSPSSTRARGRSMPPGGSIRVSQTKFARHMRTRMHQRLRHRDEHSDPTSCESCVKTGLLKGSLTDLVLTSTRVARLGHREQRWRRSRFVC